MDVYITSVSIVPTVSGNPNVNAALSANSTGELGINLWGKKAVIGLTIIARNRDSMGAWLIGSGSKFHFTTTVEGLKLHENNTNVHEL